MLEKVEGMHIHQVDGHMLVKVDSAMEEAKEEWVISAPKAEVKSTDFFKTSLGNHVELVGGNKGEVLLGAKGESVIGGFLGLSLASKIEVFGGISTEVRVGPALQYESSPAIDLGTEKVETYAVKIKDASGAEVTAGSIQVKGHEMTILTG